MADLTAEFAQPRVATCDVCRERIEGYPSVLQPGTTIWIVPTGELYGHPHTPKEG